MGSRSCRAYLSGGRTLLGREIASLLNQDGLPPLLATDGPAKDQSARGCLSFPATHLSTGQVHAQVRLTVDRLSGVETRSALEARSIQLAPTLPRTDARRYGQEALRREAVRP